MKTFRQWLEANAQLGFIKDHPLYNAPVTAPQSQRRSATIKPPLNPDGTDPQTGQVVDQDAYRRFQGQKQTTVPQQTTVQQPIQQPAQQPMVTQRRSATIKPPLNPDGTDPQTGQIVDQDAYNRAQAQRARGI